MGGVLLLVFIPSCTKENPQNGEFSPTKKIHKIYSFNNDDEKHLVETWNWNGNRLESIDYYGATNQIESVEKFRYKGNRLFRIDWISHGYDSLLTRYSIFEYEGDNLTVITQYIIRQSDTLNYYRWNFAYQDEELSQITCKRKGSSSYSVIYNLTWDVGNLIQIVEGDTKFRLEYDSKSNPMCGRFSFYFEDADLLGNMIDGIGSHFSKNNCTKLTVESSHGNTYDIGYLYDEDGYPIKQSAIATAYGANNYFFYYEYE
jgi:hypothetical protein